VQATIRECRDCGIDHLMLQAVLFDWGETLCHFEWDEELLAAGHAAGLEALGREEEAEEFTEQFRTERLPGLRADGAAESLSYAAELRSLLGDVGDDELDRFLDAEHEAWRPARALVDAGHALLETLHDRRLRLAVVANHWPEPARLVRRELQELGVTERVDRIVLAGEVGARKPAPAIFENALAQLGLDPLEAVFVGDRLGDDIAGAAGVGMSTVQALWFRADEGGEVEPDFLAFTPADVLTAVKRLGG
jgi:putative hydrolase of the HAD superfamily